MEYYCEVSLHLNVMSVNLVAKRVDSEVGMGKTRAETVVTQEKGCRPNCRPVMKLGLAWGSFCCLFTLLVSLKQFNRSVHRGTGSIPRNEWASWLGLFGVHFVIHAFLLYFPLLPKCSLAVRHGTSLVTVPA